MYISMYMCLHTVSTCLNFHTFTVCLFVLRHITAVFPLFQDDLHPEDVLPPRILKKIKPKHVSACNLHHVLLGCLPVE